MRKVRPLLVLVMFVFASSLAGAAGVNLSYNLQANSAWTMHSVIDAQVPMVGNKHLEADYDFSCSASDQDGATVSIHVPQVTSEGSTFGPVDANFRLASDGKVSKLSSDQLNDPQIGPLLKNVGMVFPKLPGNVVRAGASWSSLEVLYLPASGKKALAPDMGSIDLPETRASMPSSIRLNGTYKYLGTQKSGLEKISISFKEAGGKIKVNLGGTCFYDPKVGFATSAKLKGNIKVKKFFKWFTIPVSITSSKK